MRSHTQTVATSYDPNLVSQLATLLRQSFTDDEIKSATDKYYTEPWPREYINADTGRKYTPHHALEASVVYSDVNKHLLVKGGEGGGKEKGKECCRAGVAGGILGRGWRSCGGNRGGKIAGRRQFIR